MNRDAMRSLLIFLLAWVVIATIATYALRRAAKSPHKDIHFDVPIYPGAKNVRQEGAAEMRWVQVSYELDAKPPATEVVEYYQEQLAVRGWRSAPRTPAMEWQTVPGGNDTGLSGEKTADILWRKWVSTDELLRFDLGLTYVRGKEALPGRMTVGIEVTRNFPVTPRRRDSRTRDAND